MIDKSNPAFWVYPDGREVCRSKNPAGQAEYRRRRMEMAERQNFRCGLCGLHMGGNDITFDHQSGRGMAGSKRDDRTDIDMRWINAAVHFKCNADKGSRVVPYVIRQGGRCD